MNEILTAIAMFCGSASGAALSVWWMFGILRRDMEKCETDLMRHIAAANNSAGRANDRMDNHLAKHH